MARQSNVQGAYSKVGHPSTKRGSSGSGRCMALAGVIVFFLFFMSLGGDGDGNAENDNLGQAHHATTADQQPTKIVDYRPGISDTTGAGASASDNTFGTSGYSHEEELGAVVNAAVEDIRTAEEEQLEQSQSMLSSTMSKVGNGILIGLGKLLGNNVSEEELEEIATQVQDRLAENVASELREDADTIMQTEVYKIDSTVDNDEVEGRGYDTIEGDVRDREQDAIIHVREDISSAAVDMKTGLRGRAAEIEKGILEERLSIRLGKKVKLVIVDDEIQGVDELFNGLSSIGGNQGGGTNLGGYRNNNNPSGAGNGGYRPNNGAGNGGYRANNMQQQQMQQQVQQPVQPQTAQTFHGGYGPPPSQAGYGFDTTSTP